MTDGGRYHIYDIETYPNIFTYSGEDFETGEQVVFEWSERKNDMPEFIKFIMSLAASKVSMVGFNNVSFDYPVIHKICMNYPNITLADVYVFATSMIEGSRDYTFSQKIWGYNRIVRQIDLLSIFGFDRSKVSLKLLEFNMRMGNIQDLPYKPGIPVPVSGFDKLIEYNLHDVKATRLFFEKEIGAIDFRDSLFDRYGKDVVNYGDTKLGSEYFITRIEAEQPGTCYHKVNGQKKAYQTLYDNGVDISDVVFPYISFKSDFFNSILEWFKSKTIRETKNAISKTIKYDDVVYKFGAGGIHASVKGQIYKASGNFKIIDVDVRSYYPNVAIKNKIAPKHIGAIFCSIYESLYNERCVHDAGTPENIMLKNALNAAYGNSNSEHSPFRDTAMTLGITVNGQLMLCMLAEKLVADVPGLFIIQVNTDGVTFGVEVDQLEKARSIYKTWEQFTLLTLEEKEYSHMMIRDVNNYVARGLDGKTKQKGAYLTKPRWEQDHSFLCIPKAATAFFFDGVEPMDFLMNHDDVMDFMGRAKVPKTSRLMCGNRQIQNISRYFVSVDGEQLVEYRKPLAKSPTTERKARINVGWGATECNDITGGYYPENIDYKFYATEVEKLISFGRICND